MHRLRTLPEKTGVGLSILLIILAIAISGCGGGGGGNPPPAKEAVTVSGKVEIRDQSAPLSGAECRFVDSQGVEQASATSDEAGQYTLEVPVDMEGDIRCTPSGFSNLALSTYCSTKGLSAGDVLEAEDVTLFSTVAAQIIASEESADPVARKTEVLAALAESQDPDLNLVAELSEKLFVAMLHNNLDIDFSGGAGSQAGNDGISGHVRTGVDATPIAGARCAFVVDGPLGEGRSVLHTAALADFYDDGQLSRSDLQAVQQQINDDYDGHQQEIVDVLARVFPNGIGLAYTTTTDESGAYFLSVPPGLPGYMCCTPPDQEKLVLTAYVPGRAEGESLSGQDVSPATTVHSILIARRFSGSDVDITTTKDNFFQDIAGLQVRMVQAGNAVTGFELMPGTVPADREVGLAVFSATTLFNTLYHNQLNVDFTAVLENFFQQQSLAPESLTTQGVGAEAAQSCSAVVSGAVDQAESSLGTQLSHALSTARINVTVMDRPSGPALSGFSVSIGEEDLLCRGCDTPTNDQGQVSLFLSGLSEELSNITLTAIDVNAQQESIIQTVQVVPLATLDILMVHNYRYTLQINSSENDEYDGIGWVTSHTGDIDCYLGETENGIDWESYLNNKCSAQFDNGKSITLTAAAVESSTFEGWAGDACHGTDPTCTVTMDRERSVVALFSPRCEEIREKQLYDVFPVYKHIFSADSNNDFIEDNFPDSCGELAVNSSADWITIIEESEEDNDQDPLYIHGALHIRVSANAEAGPRTGTVLYGGYPVTIAQDGQHCSITDYGLSPTNAIFESTGGTGSIEVQAPVNCPWNAVAENDWITIASGASDFSGGGTVTYTVSENAGHAGRAGIITIAGTHHMVIQSDASSNFPLSLTIQGQGDGAGRVKISTINDVPLDNDVVMCYIKGSFASGKCNLIGRSDGKIGLFAGVEMYQGDDGFPDWDSMFSNWTGSCNGFSEECGLTMDQMHSVDVRFMVPRLAELKVSYLDINTEYLPIATPINLVPLDQMGYDDDDDYKICLLLDNLGPEQASSFSIGFYISSDAAITQDDTLLARGRIQYSGLREKINGCNAFEYGEISESPWIPADVPPGPAYLGVIIDEYDEVREDIETNNTYSVPIYLIPSN